MSRNTKQRPLTAFFTKPPINESPPRIKKQIDENTSPCIFSSYDKMSQRSNKEPINLSSDDGSSPIKSTGRQISKEFDTSGIKESLTNLNKAMNFSPSSSSNSTQETAITTSKFVFKTAKSSSSAASSQNSVSRPSSVTIETKPAFKLKDSSSVSIKPPVTVRAPVAVPVKSTNEVKKIVISPVKKTIVLEDSLDSLDLDFGSNMSPKTTSTQFTFKFKKSASPKVSSSMDIDAVLRDEYEKKIKPKTKVPARPASKFDELDSLITVLEDNKNNTLDYSMEGIDEIPSSQPDSSSLNSRSQSKYSSQSNAKTLDDFENKYGVTKKQVIKPSPILGLKKSVKKTSTEPSTSSSSKSTVSIKMDDKLIPEIERVLNSNSMKASDQSQSSAQKLEFLKEEKLKFLESYYKIINQIPMTYFSGIDGFSITSFLKLKSVVETLDSKIKNHDKSQQKPPTTIAPTAKGYRMSLISVPPPPIDDHHFDEEDQYDVDELMGGMYQEKMIQEGKSNVDYVDLSSTPVISNGSKFQPRINMATATVVSNQTVAGTDLIENIDTELDDDGWQKFDFTTLEDLPLTQPSTSDFQTARQVQNIEQKSQHNLNSKVPDANDKTAIKNMDPLGNFHAGVKNDATTGEFDGNKFPHSAEMQMYFQHKFGLKSYRSNQLQAINAVLLGFDCFILMPTGGGKSLCYQLPALLSKGVTIVISPLKSLILDQVNKLMSLDIPSAALSATLTQDETRQVYKDIGSNNPTIKLLYVTPEKISASPTFQEILDSMYRKGTLARIVIDEAHCVSAWGHDFRPDYKKLNVFKQRYPKVPAMALTATANPRVRVDVLKQLNMSTCKWFLCSFNRPNLKYIVENKGKNTFANMVNLIHTKYARASGIVYCLSRKDCDSVASKLQSEKIKAIAYHAGLADKVRESVQKDWIVDKYKVVVATVAFGMGIDKPDVRFVFHYSMPKSIEGYYQESGRAGRDGLLSTCVLFYSYADKMRYQKMFDGEPYESKQVSINNLNLITNFCENMTDCRRTQQLDYFGEHFTREQCQLNPLSACDNCSRVGQYKETDASETARQICSAVKDFCGGTNRFTVLYFVDILKGAEIKKIIDNRHNQTVYHGYLKAWERIDIQRIIHKLIIENYLREELIFCRDIPQAYLKLGSKVEQLMTKRIKITFSMLEKKKAAPKTSKKVDAAEENPLESNSLIKDLKERCYVDLIDVLRNLAAERNCTMSSILNIVALRSMSEIMPETAEEMLQVQYVTKANFEKFGQKFLEICQTYSAQKNCYLMDLQEQRESQKSSNVEESDYSYDEEEASGYEPQDNGTDWGQLAKDHSQTSSRGGGKRRFPSAGRGRGSGRKFKRRKTSPKKAAGAQAKKAAPKRFNLLPMPSTSR